MTYPSTTTAATPGPWSWEIHDASMASLCGPGGERDHVMAVSPCKSCQAGKEGWAWGRCRVPNEADARLIASAPTMLAALKACEKAIAASLKARGYKPDYASWSDKPEVCAEGEALTAARSAIAEADPTHSPDTAP